MKALAFIRAFERFMARRGTPDVVIYDNFKTFKSSVVNKFVMSWSSTEIHITCLNLVGCVLRAISDISENVLEKILGKSLLSYEQLETVLLKIESVINGRSLANLSEYDLIYDFTPNYLIYGRNIRTKSNAVSP